VSTQELTYPQESCCAAPPWRLRHDLSGFALCRAKSLILLKSRNCREIGQALPEPAKSRLWRLPMKVTHKVIHKNCGQTEKRFSIISLGVFLEMNPSFPTQLGMALG
jgi:hypothetical protein